MNRLIHPLSLKPWILALGLCAASVSAPAWAAPDMESPQPTQAGRDGGMAQKPATLSKSDKDFLEKAAQVGHTEVEASQMAVQRGTTPQVKDFARHMLDNHAKTSAELDKLAQDKGVDIPEKPSLMQRGKLKLLDFSSGTEFDQRYSRMIGTEAHKDTLELFQKTANETRDPDIKAFAESTIPTLNEHLQEAEGMVSKVDTKARREEAAKPKREDINADQ